MKNEWMSYVKQSYTISPSFINQLDKQLKLQVTKKIGKELKFERLWFYYGADGFDHDVIMPDGEKRKYFHEPALQYKWEALPVKLYWRCKTENRFIDASEEVDAETIEFVLEEIDTTYLDLFPLAGQIQPLKKINLGTTFEIILNESISQEGYLAFELEDSISLSDIEYILNEQTRMWNEEDIEIEGMKRDERGPFHNVYIDRREDNLIYYDSGYAQNEAFGYILRGLDTKVKGIKKLVIHSIP